MSLTICAVVTHVVTPLLLFFPGSSPADPPPSLTRSPPCTGSAISLPPPPLPPLAPPSPLAPPPDPDLGFHSTRFWKSCNAAGCTRALFTGFINEMNTIGSRIQSDRASQEGEGAKPETHERLFIPSSNTWNINAVALFFPQTTTTPSQWWLLLGNWRRLWPSSRKVTSPGVHRRVCECGGNDNGDNLGRSCLCRFHRATKKTSGAADGHRRHEGGRLRAEDARPSAGAVRTLLFRSAIFWDFKLLWGHHYFKQFVF